MEGDRSVLIFGQSHDAHIDAVHNHLIDMGVNVVILNKYSSEDTFSYYYDSGSFSGEIKKVNIEDVGSVWWWVKPYVPCEFSGNVGPVLERIIVQEWRHFMRSFSCLTNESTFWINNIESQTLSSWKINQLKVAQQVGLNVPKTIISNNYDKVYEFIRTKKNAIYKSLSSIFIFPDHCVFTNKISLETLEKSKKPFNITPGIFQEYVEKKHELRVMVVKDKVFSVKINSQKHKEAKVDWRKNQTLDIYEKSHLSAETEQKLLKFHSEFGLVYAAYDFIVDKNNEEIFLECNPSGQWLWLEEKLNIPISREIAELLAQNI
tara:strand:+ start:1901 stop:2857 length:957 start_codon:yes stop_codon:yes gene_type:complete